MTTHTPTPWKHLPHSDRSGLRYLKGGKNECDHVASDLDPADAALIVERVNGWDALVAERDALKAVVVGFVEYGFDCQCAKDETGPQEHADTCHVVVARRLLAGGGK